MSMSVLNDHTEERAIILPLELERDHMITTVTVWSS